MEYKKPVRLKPGDLVGIVSPSWGGPEMFPHVYENGLNFLKSLGLKIQEYPGTRAKDDYINANPQARARDINDAFADKAVKAIFTSIGGSDSIRILPYLNTSIIQQNPKIIMGYSDTTTILSYINQLGSVTFNGPSVMAGFSQANSLPAEFRQHIQEMLFSPADNYQYQEYGVYCDGYPDWGNMANIGKTKKTHKADGWRFIQGTGKVTGKLFGGCLEVLEFMNGTDYWPARDFWIGKLLFLETSEEKPSIERVHRMLRNYGMQGILGRITAILFGRARDYNDEEKRQLEESIVKVVKDEFGYPELPIITNMNFGHTDPQIILPLGVSAEIDCLNKSFQLIEAPLL